MAGTFVDAAARRHRIEEWIGTNRLPGELHVRHWAPSRVALAGLRPRRQRRSAGGLGTTSGIWSVGDDPDALVRVDVREQGDLVAAHRALPRVLAQMQAPVVRREVEMDVGDVMFGAQGGRVLVFARGNLLVVVAGVGRAPVDVVAIARAVDRSLVDPGVVSAALTDEEAAVGGSEQSPSLTIERQPDGPRRIDVQIPVAMRAEGPVMVSVRAPRGRLFERGDTLRFQPAEESTTGQVEVTLRSRTGAGRDWQLRVTP